MKRLAFILIIAFLSLDCAFAQKIRNASGMAQFRLEEDMSKDELKDKLRHHAIINAIEREYGTYVTQESFVDVDDGNTQFRIFGKTVVQGEWLKTTSFNHNRPRSCQKPSTATLHPAPPKKQYSAMGFRRKCIFIGLDKRDGLAVRNIPRIC